MYGLSVDLGTSSCPSTREDNTKILENNVILRVKLLAKKHKWRVLGSMKLGNSWKLLGFNVSWSTFMLPLEREIDVTWLPSLPTYASLILVSLWAIH